MLETLYRHDGWRIGLIAGEAATLLASDAPPITWLPIDRRGGFAADPFLIESGGRRYCFFEWLPYATDRGRICYVALDEERPAAGAIVREAIAEPYHLSYPSLLRVAGEIVCIPEAASSGCVSVYAARAFPDGWYRKHVLIAGFAGVDSTVFRHDGRWWLAAGDGAASPNSELHLWFADSFYGRWQPHPANPVVRGLAGTRPGGAPFRVAGRLYRPAQDCSRIYGGRLIINEILELTTERFVERAVRVLEPQAGSRYADGLHTANACGGTIAVDGNRRRFVAAQAVRGLRAGIARVLRATP